MNQYFLPTIQDNKKESKKEKWSTLIQLIREQAKKDRYLRLKKLNTPS